MSVTAVQSEPMAAKPAAGIDPELVKAVKASLQAETKTKVHTREEDFGSEQDDGKPIVQVDMTVDGDGRIHIILPDLIQYAETRDTTSKSRRSVVCRLRDPNGIEGSIFKSNGQEVRVKFSLSSTLNLSATAVKV